MFSKEIQTKLYRKIHNTEMGKAILDTLPSKVEYKPKRIKGNIKDSLY